MSHIAPGTARDKPNSFDETGNCVRNFCVDKSKVDDEYIKCAYVGNLDCPNQRCVICGDVIESSKLKVSF